MQTFLRDMNDLVGLFLVLIGFAIGSCAKSLASIHDELRSLHEDFEALHQAHTVKEAQQRAKYGV
jgi:hypothetical protein